MQRLSETSSGVGEGTRAAEFFVSKRLTPSNWHIVADKVKKNTGCRDNRADSRSGGVHAPGFAPGYPQNAGENECKE